MPFQGGRQQSSEKRIMTMCLILDCLPIAVRPTPVAHHRAALAPHQPQGPMRQQIWPPVRPAAVLQAAMAQLSQTVHQAPQARHALTRSQYQKQTNTAKQRATVLKRVAQLDINQLPLPKPGEPQPGPSGESNGASR